MEVPERILGVDRDLWECYLDRPPVKDFLACCSGWGTKTVENGSMTYLSSVGNRRPDSHAVLETVLVI